MASTAPAATRKLAESAEADEFSLLAAAEAPAAPEAEDLEASGVEEPAVLESDCPALGSAAWFDPEEVEASEAD